MRITYFFLCFKHHLFISLLHSNKSQKQLSLRLQGGILSHRDGKMIPLTIHLLLSFASCAKQREKKLKFVKLQRWNENSYNSQPGEWGGGLGAGPSWWTQLSVEMNCGQEECISSFSFRCAFCKPTFDAIEDVWWLKEATYCSCVHEWPADDLPTCWNTYSAANVSTLHTFVCSQCLWHWYHKSETLAEWCIYSQIIFSSILTVFQRREEKIVKAAGLCGDGCG